MEIKFKLHNSKGVFYIELNGDRIAEMTVTMAGDKLMIIDHTEVLDKLRGKGTGKQLVMAGVDYARKNNIKIIPLCPFAKSVFARTPEIADVLYKEN